MSPLCPSSFWRGRGEGRGRVRERWRFYAAIRRSESRYRPARLPFPPMWAECGLLLMRHESTRQRPLEGVSGERPAVRQVGLSTVVLHVFQQLQERDIGQRTNQEVSMCERELARQRIRHGDAK